LQGQGQIRTRRRIARAGTALQRVTRRVASALLPFLLALASAPHPAAAGPAAESGARRVLSEQNGVVTVRDGERVRVMLEMGDVRVRTQASGAVQYRLRVDAPAGSNWSASQMPRFQVSVRTNAEGATITGHSVGGRSSEHFWVTLELDVPRATPLDVSTQGGSVEVGDIDGRLVCDTAGGKIRVGKVGAAARLVTAGGDVVVQDVNGDLTATTGGGHILAGAVRGSATLRSGGGHIRVARVDGEARMDTGGGNIFLEHAGARLTTSTGGGRIMVGEASGELHARTGGGGIRVWRVAGPARIETGAGSIFLAGVTSPVRATTASGGITALFETEAPALAPAAPPAQAPKVAHPPRPVRGETLGEFECSGGDLVVFLPKDIRLNLDAVIGGGENFRIVVDPAFLLSLKTNQMASGNVFRAEGAMGGGGPMLRLRANSGNILLRPADGAEAVAVPAMPVMPAFAPVAPAPPARPGEDSMEASFANLEKSVVEMQRQLEVRQDALEAYASAQELQAFRMVRRSQEQRRMAEPRKSSPAAETSATIEYDGNSEQLTQKEDQREKFTAWLTDRVIVPEAKLRPRLARRVDPVYPERAREMGLEGSVRLRVAIARDGSIEDVKVLAGDPVLAEAATDAVRQWRYRPTVVNGRQVNVLTVLTVRFHRP
jgi:TonB family protein